MKFSIPKIEIERYQTIDIIAASPDHVDPTTPTASTANTDPYEADKW